MEPRDRKHVGNPRHLKGGDRLLGKLCPVPDDQRPGQGPLITQRRVKQRAGALPDPGPQAPRPCGTLRRKGQPL